MVLAYCTTFFHLFNIIQLKLTLLANEKVDLILSSDTNFRTLQTNLVKSGLFENVIISPIKNGVWSREYNECPDEKKTKLFVSLVAKGSGLPIQNSYQDLYFGLDDPYNKFLYYCLAQKGNPPKVHLFDEGAASYVLSYKQRIKTDKIPHNMFPGVELEKNFCESLLYAPELCEGFGDLPVNQIPKIDRNDEKSKAVFNSIFVHTKLSSERYVFFEGGAFQDWLPTFDIEILDQFAKIVGKENILVKLHPRTISDRFSRRGYHVMKAENVPWEIYALNESIEDRVCISNASTAALTLYTIFSLKIPCINFFKMDFLEKSIYTRQKVFPQIYRIQEKLFNKDKPTFFSPSNFEELRKIITYLEMLT